MDKAVTHQPAVELRFLAANVRRETRPDGIVILRTEAPLAATDMLTHDHLKQWAEARPGQTFLAERNAAGEVLPFRHSIRAMALAGIGLSALSSLTIVAQAIPTFLLAGCE